MSEWISVKDKLPPKDEKFLFHYYYGIGLGAWGPCYENRNNNSECTHEAYIMVLWPVHEDYSPSHTFYWDYEALIEFDVYWQPLPKEPNEQ